MFHTPIISFLTLASDGKAAADEYYREDGQRNVVHMEMTLYLSVCDTIATIQKGGVVRASVANSDRHFNPKL